MRVDALRTRGGADHVAPQTCKHPHTDGACVRVSASHLHVEEAIQSADCTPLEKVYSVVGHGGGEGGAGGESGGEGGDAGGDGGRGPNPGGISYTPTMSALYGANITCVPTAAAPENLLSIVRLPVDAEDEKAPNCGSGGGGGAGSGANGGLGGASGGHGGGHTGGSSGGGGGAEGGGHGD